MLAVGPLGQQYCRLFVWYELGRQAHLGVDTLHSNLLYGLVEDLNFFVVILSIIPRKAGQFEQVGPSRSSFFEVVTQIHH